MPVAIDFDGNATGGSLGKHAGPVRGHAGAAVVHASLGMPEDGDTRLADAPQHPGSLIFGAPQQRVRGGDHELEHPPFLDVEIE